MNMICPKNKSCITPSISDMIDVVRKDARISISSLCDGLKIEYIKALSIEKVDLAI